jgi:hypothetical protein
MIDNDTQLHNLIHTILGEAEAHQMRQQLLLQQLLQVAGSSDVAPRALLTPSDFTSEFHDPDLDTPFPLKDALYLPELGGRMHRRHSPENSIKSSTYTYRQLWNAVYYPVENYRLEHAKKGRNIFVSRRNLQLWTSKWSKSQTHEHSMEACHTLSCGKPAKTKKVVSRIAPNTSSKTPSQDDTSTQAAIQAILNARRKS